MRSNDGLLREAAREMRHESFNGQTEDAAFLEAVADLLEKMSRAMLGTSYGDLPFEEEVVTIARNWLRPGS